MAFWDGVGDFFSEHGADIAVGAVSVAGFAVGGPLGAAVAGGIAGGVAAGFKDENILVGAGLGVAGGLVGGLGGVAFRGSAKGVVGGLLRQGRSLDIAQGMGSTAEKIAFQRSGLFAKRIPEMLGGAHLSPWKTYMGLFGAAFTPQTMDFIEGIPDKWHQYTGYPEIPLIDISAEELSEIPADMPHIMMPDPARLPEGLELTAPVEANYRTLPPAYKAYWNSFGEKPGKLDPPKELDVADISGEDKAGIANYPQKVEEMRKRFADLRSEASKIDELNDQTGLLCDAGRRDFTAVVQALERFAELDARGLKFIDRLQSEYSQKTSEYSGLPVFEVNTKIMSTGVPSEDVYAMVLVEAGYVNAESILTWYVNAFETLGVKIDSEKSATEQKKQREQPSGSPQTTPTTATDTDPYYNGAPSRTSPTAQPSPSTVAAPTPWDLTSGTRSGSDADRAIAADQTDGGTDTDPLGAASATGTSDPAAAVAAATPDVASMASPASNGMGSALQSMLLPQLMQTMLEQKRRGAEDDGEKERRDGRDRQDDEAAVAALPGPAPATNTAPAAHAPGQPAAVPNGDAKTVSARPDPGQPGGKPMPANVSEGKANRVYTFPDGRTQEVSVVVARALDAAFGNAAGTDARTAYTGTPAEWTDPKRIGRRIGPSEVMTGDIGVWEERTAVLVAFEGQDTLEAVIDGGLVVVAELSRMRDDAGEFGGFVGIFHPAGIEKAADESAATAVPAAPVDQTGPGLVVSA
jgi:hypothetical protein